MDYSQKARWRAKVKTAERQDSHRQTETGRQSHRQTDGETERMRIYTFFSFVFSYDGLVVFKTY